MSTLLVTGVAGFIGSHLTRRLTEAGHRVVGIDNFDAFYDRRLKEANVATLDAQRVDVHEADICDAATIGRIVLESRPQAIFHIAALAGVRPSIAEPARYAHVNVDGLVNILEAARAAMCRNIVFASSSSVYGNRSTVPFSEDDDVSAPISPYAATKRAGELLCSAYAHLHGLSIAGLRFFTVFGPGQRPDLAISKFMRMIAADEAIPMFGDGTTSRDYTYIDDIIDGVVAAHRVVTDADDGFCRVYNLGGSKPVMLSDMIERIGQVMGRIPRVDRQPMQPGDVDRTYADLTRSLTELDYGPKTEFDEGLRRQWAWMRQSLSMV